MKVLFIATVDLSGQSGHNIATREVVSALKRNEHTELSLICPKPEYAERVEELFNDINVYYLSAKKQRSLWWNLKIQFQMISVLRKAVKKARPDLVVTRIGNCFTLPLLVKLYKLPYYLLVRGVGSREIKGLSKIPGLDYLWKLGLLLHCRAARQVYVAYEEVKQEVEAYRKPQQLPPVVFTNAVDPELFPCTGVREARKMLNLPVSNDDFVIGFAGSIKKRHGLELLIEALRNIKTEIENIKVLIAGDGPELAGLKQFVEEKGLKQEVIFTGFIEHEKIYLYMASSDILYGVIDPGTVENPIKCYEYLASARPVITSVKEEFEFVQSYDFGVAIDGFTSEEVVNAISKLYYLGEEKRLAMGERAREYVLKHHTWDRLVDLILEDYEKAGQ